MELGRDGQLKSVLSLLEVVRGPDGEGRHTAWCPFHPDGQGTPPHHPNLRVSAKGYICFACGEKGPLWKLAKHLGVAVSADQGSAKHGGGRDPITYDYRGEDGEPLFQVVRGANKRFFQRRPDGQGGWVNNRQGVRRVLYRLPELGARPADTVFLVEGEKDADNLAPLGLLATTNPGGAGKWRNEYTEVLAGRDVVILPDNDVPGRSHAEAVAEALEPTAASVKIVELPDLPDKGDVSDWLAAGHTVEELLALVTDAPAREAVETDWTDEDGELPDADRRLANRLVRHVLSSSDIDLFHDQRREAYAAVRLEGGRRILQLKGGEFQAYLSVQAVLGLRQACGGETLNAATTALAGLAWFRRPRHDLHVRCARADGALYLDLDGLRAVKVTPDGWKLVDEPPILFRCFPHQDGLPEPVTGGDPREVLQFVNIAGEDDCILLVCYLVAAMVPDVPVAALVVHGVHGSAKTTLLKIVKRLLDPSRVEVRGGARDLSEFALAAWQSRVLFFDNITSVPGWLSDAICRTVTGDAWSKRKLYTDEDSVIFEHQRVVGLASINVVTNRPDLLDRSLILQLEPLAPEDRLDEETFWARFDELRPEILGGILDTLAAAMRLLPKLDLPRLPRLADFARWGAAAAEALGYGAQAFLDAFERNVGRQHQAAVEASPVAQAVVSLMESRWTWEGTPSGLLAALNGVAQSAGIDTHSRYWPKDPNWVTRRIRDVQPDLGAMGIEFHERRSGLHRTILLQKSSAKAVTADTAATAPFDGADEAPGGDDSDDSDGSPGTSGRPGQLPYKTEGDQAAF